MSSQTTENNLKEQSTIWLETLVSYRSRINNLKDELYYFAPGKEDIDVRKGIDHFHNQFHIQLVNIHDLKHDVKRHITELNNNVVYAVTDHSKLEDQVNHMVAYLNNLEDEFKTFTAS